MDAKSGNLKENFKRKSGYHIPQQIFRELIWKIDQIYKNNIQNIIKTLLKPREPDNDCERITEEKVNKKFQEIIRKKNQIESVTDEMVKKAIAKLKNKRASDSFGWRVEWLKEGGEEIAKSLSILFNRIEREQKTLAQWRQTIIKSIYIGVNKVNISESQRGIFLVNTISKVYELVKIIQNGKK